MFTHHLAFLAPISRRLGLLAVMLLLALPASAEEPDAAARSLGDPDAPVVVYDYSSMTCGACGRFHSVELAAIKAQLIDTGRLRLVFRDAAFNPVAVRAHQLARCMPAERVFPFLDMVFAAQGDWLRDDDPVQAVGNLAKIAGLSQDEVDACFANRAVEDAVLAETLGGQREFGVESTPTFVFNDGAEILVGVQTVDAFTRVVDRLDPKN